MTRHLPWIATVAVALMSAPAAAQQGLHREDAIEIRTQFLADLDSLTAKFTALANAFPDEKFTWRPGEGVRSVGEVFMHVAYEYYTFIPFAYGGHQSSDVPQGKGAGTKFEQASSKADALKHLAAGSAYAKAQIEAVDPNTLVIPKTFGGHPYSQAELSLILTGDLHEHLGQLIAYARANGITPPWSKKP